jgi:hypothetical protein
VVPVQREYRRQRGRLQLLRQYHPEDEVNAQWFGRGGVESAIGPAYNNHLTFMGPLTTGLGGPFAGFGSYAQGC